MNTETEAELRAKIVSLETRMQNLEHELKEMNEGLSSLMRELIATLRGLTNEEKRNGAH